MFAFRQATVFLFGTPFLKAQMTTFAKNSRSMAPGHPLGHAYVRWLLD